MYCSSSNGLYDSGGSLSLVVIGNSILLYNANVMFIWLICNRFCDMLCNSGSSLVQYSSISCMVDDSMCWLLSLCHVMFICD